MDRKKAHAARVGLQIDVMSAHLNKIKIHINDTRARKSVWVKKFIPEFCGTVPQVQTEHLFRDVCWRRSGKFNSIHNVHSSEISDLLPKASAAMDRTERRKQRKPPLQISINICQAHLVCRVQNIETDICKVRS